MGKHADAERFLVVAYYRVVPATAQISVMAVILFRPACRSDDSHLYPVPQTEKTQIRRFFRRFFDIKKRKSVFIRVYAF